MLLIDEGCMRQYMQKENDDFLRILVMEDPELNEVRLGFGINNVHIFMDAGTKDDLHDLGLKLNKQDVKRLFNFLSIELGVKDNAIEEGKVESSL